MQTNLPAQLLQTQAGQRADSILRSCVHCGFCTATCPTYQLLGDELDGPRGRIYQIKQMLESGQVSADVQLHLDRCLTCRSCETTCPSGVRYSELLDIGRDFAAQQRPRPPWQRLQRWALRKILPYPRRFSLVLQLGQLAAPLLPRSLQKKLPKVSPTLMQDRISSPRKILMLDGCVQSVVTPDVNAMANNILARLGFQVIRPTAAGCCGAVSTHLSALAEGKAFVKRNIDAWWPLLEDVEAIIATASGCGVMLQDYASLMADEGEYADKARRISALVKDPAAILAAEDLAVLQIKPTQQKIAFHSPCTLQHGLKQQGVVEAILSKVGFQLVQVNDAHLCCGSAGTYSVLQAEIANQLLTNKLASLSAEQPDLIVTANIGCQMHLQSGTEIPVKHWLSLLQ